MDSEPKEANDPPQQQQPLNEGGEEEMDEEYDDLDDLGMFHKSSLKEKQQLPLPEIANEEYGVKRYLDPTNQSKIGLYTQHEKIGRGAFAEVLRVEKEGQFFAMKVYSLLKLRSQRFFAADGSFANGEEMLRNEIDIIKRLNHQNLVKCHQILYGGNYVYVVGELCDFGQLMNWDEDKKDYIRNQKVTGYIGQKYGMTNLEDITRLIFLQAGLGVQYMHQRNITNRDIKIDNILCRTTTQQGADIKIADFTTVRFMEDDISFFPSGTPGFRGPEQQFASSDGYSCKATDIWSLGVSMYTFYRQHFPFMGETELQIDIKAQNDALQFTEGTPVWLKEVIEKMTCKNWKERINIDQVIQILASEH